MFNLLFGMYMHNTQSAPTEYTPAMPAHLQIHDASEGDEFVDDALRMEDEIFLPKEGTVAAG